MASSKMSKDHLIGIQKGREEGIAVRNYLLALHGEVPHRKVLNNTERLQKIKEELAICSNPLQRLKLLQRQYNLENGTASTENLIDLASLERKFIQIAKDYSERQRIVREVWEEAGVTPDVLDKAGVS